MRNWAGNITFNAAKIGRPTRVEEIQDIVRRADKLRVVGSGHSFNTIADTDGTLITLADMPRAIRVDPTTKTITTSGGTTYAQILPALAESGLGLATGASLPHITIAGAAATSTHGSGDANQNLSAAVSALTFVRADGEIVKLQRGDADFDGAVVNLGALGVVVDITLDTVPAYDIAQTVFTGLPVSTALAEFDAITSSAYSVSMFTRWNSTNVDQLWQKALSATYTPAQRAFGASLASQALHPIAEFDGTTCTQQGGIAGSWGERIFHFPASATPSAGNELQSEFYVDRKNAVAAFAALYAIQEQFNHTLYVSEIRTMAADTLWMSGAYGRDTVGFHFTWKPDAAAVSTAVDIIEATLAPFEPRPHWAKVFNMAPTVVQSRYPKLAEFKQLANRFDPNGKFRNSYLTKLLF
ncbi:FAD-binding protein [Devosia sp. WQ 349]|uniref:FAD-binding protein n=1 Tax=Devosia sp. WQ 349K1 TaxID=2800329 RepID=UPI001902F708|nr:FAD-binding protein [Devosia sp. WQ 349K1]MBK1793514.1 FAD-binding protein [Devosia sp. WQ 349K1]